MAKVLFADSFCRFYFHSVRYCSVAMKQQHEMSLICDQPSRIIGSAGTRVPAGGVCCSRSLFFMCWLVN